MATWAGGSSRVLSVRERASVRARRRHVGAERKVGTGRESGGGIGCEVGTDRESSDGCGSRRYGGT